MCQIMGDEMLCITENAKEILTITSVTSWRKTISSLTYNWWHDIEHVCEEMEQGWWRLMLVSPPGSSKGAQRRRTTVAWRAPRLFSTAHLWVALSSHFCRWEHQAWYAKVTCLMSIYFFYLWDTAVWFWTKPFLDGFVWLLPL